MFSKSFFVRSLIFIVLIFVGVLAWRHFARPTAHVAEVRRETAFNSVPGSVIIDAEFTMDLKSELGGRVVKTFLDEGKTVKQGAVLAQIDTGDLELEIERTDSELRAARDRIAVGSQIALELETARADLENTERMAKLGGVADSDLQKQRRMVKQVEQKLELERVSNKEKIEALENTLKTKRRQLAKMTITAPFDGVISKVFARVGDLIGNNTPIASLISTSRTIAAKISEENFSGIQIGQKASVRFLGYGDQLYGASVAKILPTADPTTQRYIVHLNVDLKPELQVPGITGEVSILVGERPNALTVPRRAVVGGNVFVVRNGVVELRPVKTGFVSLTSIEILSGLALGETVIDEELDRFRSGDRVRLAEAKVAP